jgi:hypothetical protein
MKLHGLFVLYTNLRFVFEKHINCDGIIGFIGERKLNDLDKMK